MAKKDSIPIRIINPRRLRTWQIECERIPLGEPGDFKPSLALLPNGELVMVAFFQEQKEEGKIREWTTIFRSKDGGKTWSERKIIQDMIGREQWLTCTSDGTLFGTSHLLIRDINNKDGVVHSYLHRSTDGGETWERTKILLEEDLRCGEPLEKSTHTSRNIVELPDGTLLLGVSLVYSDVAYFWRSKDRGKTWDKSLRVKIKGYYNNADGFFCEDFTFRTDSGKLLHIIRVGPPSPMYPMNDGRITPSGDDHIDRMMMCESTDEGRSWSPLQDFGDYGMHYPRVLKLKDGRLLLTFTQRGIFYPIGLQAVLSYDEGRTWDFNSDRIIIEGKTPWGITSGGGFGNTVQLEDETLISCYSYRKEDNQTYLEVVRWRLP